MGSQSIAEILTSVLDAFNAHDLDRIMSYFSDDCILEMPRGPDPWGSRYVGFAAVGSWIGAYASMTFLHRPPGGPPVGAAPE